MESKIKLCQRCHHSFIGNTVRCPTCLSNQEESRRNLKATREKNGLCVICGKPREDHKLKSCRACRAKMKTFYKEREIKNISIKKISDILRQIFIKHKTQNRYTIMDEIQTKLELLGIK